MFLKAGKVLRFRGPNAETDLAGVAKELQGDCRREGNSLVITSPKRVLFIDSFPGVHHTPRFREDEPATPCISAYVL
jgi:hypothetical protein